MRIVVLHERRSLTRGSLMTGFTVVSSTCRDYIWVSGQKSDKLGFTERGHASSPGSCDLVTQRDDIIQT